MDANIIIGSAAVFAMLAASLLGWAICRGGSALDQGAGHE